MPFSRVQRFVIAVLPVIPLGLFTLTAQLKADNLEQRTPYRAITGTVSRLDCGARGSYLVTYILDHKQVTLRRASNQCKQMQLGQAIPLWISERTPGFVSFDQPETKAKSLRNSARAIWFAYPILCAVVGFGCWRWNRQVAHAERHGWPS